jgi:teichuronic acid biosynthesis glycosyltransferase TuaG
MINPLISIIMPAYNAHKYISLSIESVIKQSYLNWELIIIDDYSSDNTFTLAKKYEKQNSKVIVYHNELNMGVSKTRNRGIELAQGDYIAFLDSDDIWCDNKLELQVKYCYEENADFVITGIRYINDKGKAFPGEYYPPKNIDYHGLLKNNSIACSSVLIKKKIISKYFFENDKIHEDYLLWLRILKDGVLAKTVPNPLLIYRIYGSSKSGNKLKSIKMTFGVYKAMKINFLYSSYYTIRHTLKAYRKYRRIYRIEK